MSQTLMWVVPLIVMAFLAIWPYTIISFLEKILGENLPYKKLMGLTINLTSGGAAMLGMAFLPVSLYSAAFAAIGSFCLITAIEIAFLILLVASQDK